MFGAHYYFVRIKIRILRIRILRYHFLTLNAHINLGDQFSQKIMEYTIYIFIYVISIYIHFHIQIDE